MDCVCGIHGYKILSVITGKRLHMQISHPAYSAGWTSLFTKKKKKEEEKKRKKKKRYQSTKTNLENGSMQ